MPALNPLDGNYYCAMSTSFQNYGTDPINGPFYDESKVLTTKTAPNLKSTYIDSLVPFDKKCGALNHPKESLPRSLIHQESFDISCPVLLDKTIIDLNVASPEKHIKNARSLSTGQSDDITDIDKPFEPSENQATSTSIGPKGLCLSKPTNSKKSKRKKSSTTSNEHSANLKPKAVDKETIEISQIDDLPQKPANASEGSKKKRLSSASKDNKGKNRRKSLSVDNESADNKPSRNVEDDKKTNDSDIKNKVFSNEFEMSEDVFLPNSEKLELETQSINIDTNGKYDGEASLGDFNPNKKEQTEEIEPDRFIRNIEKEEIKVNMDPISDSHNSKENIRLPLYASNVVVNRYSPSIPLINSTDRSVELSDISDHRPHENELPWSLQNHSQAHNLQTSFHPSQLIPTSIGGTSLIPYNNNHLNPHSIPAGSSPYHLGTISTLSNLHNNVPSLTSSSLPPSHFMTSFHQHLSHLHLHPGHHHHHHHHLHNIRSKRLRTSFKHHQLKTMKTYFALNHNPDAKDLKQLSQKTGLSKRVLQVWFQNARAKYRRNISSKQQQLQGNGEGSLDEQNMGGSQDDLNFLEGFEKEEDNDRMGNKVMMIGDDGNEEEYVGELLEPRREGWNYNTPNYNDGIVDIDGVRCYQQQGEVGGNPYHHYPRNQGSSHVKGDLLQLYIHQNSATTNPVPFSPDLSSRTAEPSLIHHASTHNSEGFIDDETSSPNTNYGGGSCGNMSGSQLDNDGTSGPVDPGDYEIGDLPRCMSERGGTRSLCETGAIETPHPTYFNHQLGPTGYPSTLPFAAAYQFANYPLIAPTTHFDIMGRDCGEPSILSELNPSSYLLENNYAIPFQRIDPLRRPDTSSLIKGATNHLSEDNQPMIFQSAQTEGNIYPNTYNLALLSASSATIRASPVCQSQ